VFTARYGLMPYINQITFRLLKVKEPRFWGVGSVFNHHFYFLFHNMKCFHLTSFSLTSLVISEKERAESQRVAKQIQLCFVTDMRSSSRSTVSTRAQQNITKMLLLISTVFVLLNLPRWVCLSLPTCVSDRNHELEALLLLGQSSSEKRRRVTWQSRVNDTEGNYAIISRVESADRSKNFIMSNLNTTNVLQKQHTLILYFHTVLLNIRTPLSPISISHHIGAENQVGREETYVHLYSRHISNTNVTHLHDESTKTISQYKETLESYLNKPPCKDVQRAAHS
jgi:hypothetical protein